MSAKEIIILKNITITYKIIYLFSKNKLCKNNKNISRVWVSNIYIDPILVLLDKK